MSLQNLMWVCTRRCFFSENHLIDIKECAPCAVRNGPHCLHRICSVTKVTVVFFRTAIGACADIPFALTAVELHCIEKSLQRS